MDNVKELVETLLDVEGDKDVVDMVWNDVVIELIDAIVVEDVTVDAIVVEDVIVDAIVVEDVIVVDDVLDSVTTIDDIGSMVGLFAAMDRKREDQFNNFCRSAQND